MLCFRKTPKAKKDVDERERWRGVKERVSRFAVYFFCLTVPKNFVGTEKIPSVLCFGKSPLSKKFLDKKEGVGGSIQKVFRFLLSHSAGKFRRANLLCVRNTLLSKKLMDKGEKEGVSRYSVRFFCLIGRKVFIVPIVSHNFWESE